MNSSVRHHSDAVHPQTLGDVRPVMAKASVKKVNECWKVAHGRVLVRAIQIAGLSQKEAADALGTDESTLSRWLKAKEPQQTWRFEQHPVIGTAYLQAQAETRAADDSAVVVVTQISIRQRKVVA